MTAQDVLLESVGASYFTHAVVNLQVGIVGGHDRGSGVAAQLDSDISGILKAAARQLRDKSPKTRAAVFLVLKELVVVAPVSVTRDIDQLMPGIIAALKVRPFLNFKLVCLRVYQAGQIQAASLSKAIIASSVYRNHLHSRQQAVPISRFIIGRPAIPWKGLFAKLSICRCRTSRAAHRSSRSRRCNFLAWLYG